MEAAGSKIRTAGLSVASNSVLVVAKVAAGIVSGSVGILAEALHSAVDLVAAVIALVAVRVADNPADDSHAYGHGKYENLSGTVEAVLLIGAAVYLIYEGVARIIHNAEVEQLGFGMAVMFASGAINWLVSARLFKVARETDSIALEADGQHLRLDVYTSLGVFAGLVAVQLTGLAIIDRLIGMGVALWIAWVGVRLSQQALGPLMDSQLPEQELEQITSILDSERKVLGFHKLRTRKSGAQRHIDVHLLVQDNMSVAEAHQVAEEVEDQIRGELDNVTVVTHVEPEGDEPPA